MSKILIGLLLVAFIILEQIYFISTVFAVATCSNSGLEITFPQRLSTIGQGIPFLSENLTTIILNFEVKNDNVFNNSLTYINPADNQRTGRNVRLNFGTGIFPGQTSLSRPATVDVNIRAFTLYLTDQTLRSRGEHWGRLEVQDPPGGDFVEFCTDIKYQVGSSNNCIIDRALPTQIPPGSRLTIKFFGIANTRYGLQTTLTAVGGQTYQTTTDGAGQGVFPDIPIPGSNGDTTTITIAGITAVAEPCSKDIRILATAPPPPTPAPGPVLPTPTGPAGTPAAAGGVPCDPPDPANPGFKTAIGCIHTSPAALVKDVMGFVVGISGGFAFLMMLLGTFQMLTSAGNPETLATGKDRFTNAIIGLLFVIFAVLLLQIIGFDILRLPGFGR